MQDKKIDAGYRMQDKKVDAGCILYLASSILHPVSL
jgi:hypothetical protein